MKSTEPLIVMIIGVCILGTTAPAQTTRPTSRPTTHPTSQPATEPSSRPAAKTRQPDPLKIAIQELQREAQAALQQHKPFPREKSDYFPAGNSIDPKALIAVLGTRQHQNPRVDAYIKLQLLSAVESFEGDLALPAMKAYVLGAPPMLALPGMTQQEQQKWNQKVMLAKEADVAAINKEWDDFLSPFFEANKGIEAYRDLMKSKIKPPAEIKHKYFQACMEDLSQRAAAGFDTEKGLIGITRDLSSWAHTAKRAQVLDAIAGVKEYTLRRAPKMYEKVTWRESSKKAGWLTHDAQLNVKKLENLLEELQKASESALE